MIAGSDPNEENMNYGFKMASGRRQGLVYIGWSINSGPLDQTNSKDGIDATYEAVENQHSNGRLTWGAHRSDGL